MINAKVGDITFDDVDDGMNNQHMVVIEHKILIESERDIYCFNLLGISPIKVHRKPFSSRKSLGKRKKKLQWMLLQKKLLKL